MIRTCIFIIKSTFKVVLLKHDNLQDLIEKKKTYSLTETQYIFLTDQVHLGDYTEY